MRIAAFLRRTPALLHAAGGDSVAAANTTVGAAVCEVARRAAAEAEAIPGLITSDRAAPLPFSFVSGDTGASADAEVELLVEHCRGA
eukprot:5823730-Prymnesium_polylepis.1